MYSISENESITHFINRWYNWRSLQTSNIHDYYIHNYFGDAIDDVFLSPNYFICRLY